MSDEANTVLVVDDCPAILCLLQIVLSSAGYAVSLAANGAEAIQQLKANPSSIVLALVDIRMPVLDGPATVERLRSLRPELPYAFMSGEASPYTPEALLQAGAVGFLYKPFPIEELLLLVQQFSQGVGASSHT